MFAKLFWVDVPVVWGDDEPLDGRLVLVRDVVEPLASLNISAN
jgi:hypothetical protein